LATIKAICVAHIKHNCHISIHVICDYLPLSFSLCVSFSTVSLCGSHTHLGAAVALSFECQFIGVVIEFCEVFMQNFEVQSVPSAAFSYRLPIGFKCGTNAQNNAKELANICILLIDWQVATFSICMCYEREVQANWKWIRKIEMKLLKQWAQNVAHTTRVTLFPGWP